MMLYWHFRNLQCIVVALFKPRLSRPTAPLTKTFWANPFDSDWMNSIQAGRYFTYTDAARWELALRAGFLKPALKNKWVVILGGQKIIYRRPVKLFRSFKITMQFVGWDDKWLYAAHVFHQKNDVKCVSFTKIGLRGPGKKLVSPHEVFRSMGHTQTQEAPHWVLKHFESDVETLQEASTMLAL
jgi:acyl-CoA thioesterase FadM